MALAASNPPKELFERLNARREQAKKLPKGGPLTLPYDETGIPKGAGPVGSAARNVPFCLSLFLKESNPEKNKERRSDLIAAIENYVT